MKDLYKDTVLLWKEGLLPYHCEDVCCYMIDISGMGYTFQLGKNASCSSWWQQPQSNPRLGPSLSCHR